MWEAVLAILIIGGFFVLRAVLATVFFYYLLPEGDRCPNCDAVTLRVQSRWWNLLMPRFRTSWCYECDWHGLLRNGPLTPAPPTAKLTKHTRSAWLKPRTTERRVEPEPLGPVPGELEEVVEVDESYDARVPR